jgi:quercetin dioxygenase-like cupin family protein
MINRRVLLSGAGAALAQAVLSNAQAQGGSAKVIFQHDLPDLSLKDWSVTVVEVTYPPGASSPPHRHPGLTIAYVLEGQIRSKVGDGLEKTYEVGEMFLETPNQLHGVSGNGSTTKPAKLLAMLLAEKGKQLTTPAVAYQSQLPRPPD